MKRIYYISIILIGLFMSGCHDWLDINENPNVPSEVGYEKVLPAGISSVSYVMGGRYQVLGALWSQHWTQSLGASQYSGIDSYDINSSSFETEFNELYAGALKALEYVRTESAAEQEWNYYLIATVMQAYTFQILADLYDQIPFTEALSGDQNNLTPKYDKGQDVYDSLIVRLNVALAKDYDDEDLKEPAEEDFVFGGDMDSWIEFANTLKLKLYLRQSEVRPELARQGIEELYEEEVEFLSLDAAFVHFENESGLQNPIYATDMVAFGNNPNLVLSHTLHKYLEAEPKRERLDNMFYYPDEGSSHKSLVQGNYNDPDEPNGTNSSSYSKPILLPYAPVYLMSFTESCYLQAEAIMRYNVASYSDAKEKYNDGFRAALWRVLQLSNNELTTELLASIETYINKDEFNFPTEGSELELFIEQISIQKWISLAGIQSLETFFEQNRTKYPKISEVEPDDANYVGGQYTVSANNVTSGRFPKRLLFPESEIAANPNTPVIKFVWEKIWWDVKPE